MKTVYCDVLYIGLDNIVTFLLVSHINTIVEMQSKP